MKKPLPVPSSVTPEATKEIGLTLDILKLKTPSVMYTEDLLQSVETRNCHQRFIPDFIFHSSFIHFALGDLLAGTVVPPGQDPNWAQYRVSQLAYSFGAAVKEFAVEYYSGTQIIIEKSVGPTIELYRGTSRDAAELLRNDLKSLSNGARLQLPSLSSWSDKPDLAIAFAKRGGGVVVKVTWPAHSVFAHWKHDRYLEHTLRYQCEQHIGKPPEKIGGEVIIWHPLGAILINHTDIYSSFEQTPKASTLKEGVS